ncbi:MAG: nucleotide exchange factor GrpE [Bacteriovoracaceae bacterium]|jgi:molecular chaperone GrpE|nr:nucleotide exchange factor GrpE [Bacteriovoracaceae bacterium]
MSEVTSEKDNTEPINPEVETEINDKQEDSAEETTEAEENIAELKAKEPKEEDFKEKYYYLAAEMENLRKRFDREKQNLLKYGSEKILSGLLEVMDNLDRTSDAIAIDEDEKIKNVFTGIEMVKKQFVEVLKTNGLEQVETLGQKFDPNIHEAIAAQPTEGKGNDEIITEFQKGYTLNGRLLRAAKVVIVNND